MIIKEKNEDENIISDEKKLINSKIIYKKFYKTKNKFLLIIFSYLNIKSKLIFFKYFFILLIFFFYFYLIINIRYLINFNLNYFSNEAFFNDNYNKDLIKNNSFEIKKSDILLLKKEEHNEITNKKVLTFLNDSIINNFNNYIKICLNGTLIDKKRYPLLKFPKISVIIPLYKGSKYLHYSLRSVQNQKMKEIEIILIDDCSQDESLNLIKKYMKEDERIRLIENKINRKILYSKSIAALNSNGKYILQLDQDDLFLRNDAFDILYNEAERNNLDLTQIRDIFINKLILEKKTRINFIGRHFIFLRTSNNIPAHNHYKTQNELKNTIFLNGCVFPLWGLLIKTEIYKKTIYHLWPFIMNYELIYYEDYLISTFIVIISKKYKYLNNFALIHLNHKKSASNKYIRKFFLSLLFYANIFFNYYIKNNPEDIKICINLIKRYIYIYKPSYKLYSKLFEDHIIKILNNQYLSNKDKNFIFKALKINPIKFKIWNSYKHIMNSTQYKSILIFQNSNDKYHIQSIKKKPIISVIIYCDEFKYLLKTLYSIINQKFDKYEIILIYDNNNYKNFKLIKSHIKVNQNIKIINNKKRKGILYSYSKGILISCGDFILTLKAGETLATENILNELYKTINNNIFDILEFNLLINNHKYININSLSLYKCKHFKREINLDSFKYKKNKIEIYQEKDLLTNKLIKGNLFRNIISKYKFIEFKRIVYNFYDEIILFLIFKSDIIFKKIDIYGIIQYINDIKLLNFNNIISNKNQKINDSIFYINFLFEEASNTFKDKKNALDEFYNLLSIIYNKYNKITEESISLYKKFINSNYISNFDKINLNFYFKSLIN